MNQRFHDIIGTREELRRTIPEPSRLVADKVIGHLDDHCRRFIAASPFLVMASTNAAGHVDLSPKGDPAGFVQVLDDRTLAIPDRLGNNRADSLCNLIEDERLGLIFLVPGKSETLRISGRALIVRDQWLLDQLAHKHRPPRAAITLAVERAFFHCSKCMIRSGLWTPQSWPDKTGLPTLAETMVSHGRLKDTVADIDEIVRHDARSRLY